MPNFPSGDTVKVGGTAVTNDWDSYKASNLTPGPALASATLDVDFDVLTLEFTKPIFNATSTAALMKAEITIATDGETFGALNASDTISIEGNYMVITFNTALNTATNVVKIDAGAIQDALGTANAVITTDALDASGE